jgi:hypothetical protein
MCMLFPTSRKLTDSSFRQILAGFHEVAVTTSTLEAIESTRSLRPERPLIRISSTFFWHLSSDYELRPLPGLKIEKREVAKEYLPIKVGSFVQASVFPLLFSTCIDMLRSYAASRELKHISLMA